MLLQGFGASAFARNAYSLARLLGEFFDGFLTVIAATAMLYWMRSALLQQRFSSCNSSPRRKDALCRTGGPTFPNHYAYRMIQRRAKAVGIKTRIGSHTFRATGTTAYLKNSSALEKAQHIANQESPRATKLYDRRQDKFSFDEVERISI